MGSYSWIKERADELHQVNFVDIIKYKDLDLNNVYEGAFGSREEMKKRFAAEENYCNLCDRDKSYEPSDGNRIEGYRLTNISHGAHTLDFLHAFGLSEDEIMARLNSEWIDDPVLFLMENPSTDSKSVDSKIYDYAESDESKNGKRPAANWYWIHGNLEGGFRKGYYEDQRYLVQQQYGGMVASLIYQFKLGNAYLTNLVKCGISDARMENGRFVESGYRNLDDYSNECKCKCMNQILKKEIKALCGGKEPLRPLRIFAFGDRPFWMIQDYLKNGNTGLQLKYQVYQLPHPASREKNMYRRHILRGILQEAFISDGFKLTGETGKEIETDIVRRIFKEVYDSREKTLGYKVTQNQYALKMNSYKSIFSDKEIVTEIWVIGDKTDRIEFRWGIGYVFETKSYWYWNYDDEREVEDINTIPDWDLFKKAISKLLNESSDQDV